MFCHINSPLGGITLAAREDGISGLWFDGQRHFAAGLSPDAVRGTNRLLDEAAGWVARYFEGRDPGPPPPLSPRGTPYQRAVWELLRTVPRGETVSYGALARQLGSSPRGIGQAVGRNPISLMIPCHRVVGADGSVTGYAGGTERKLRLLMLEGAELTPRRSPEKDPPSTSTAQTGRTAASR